MNCGKPKPEALLTDLARRPLELLGRAGRLGRDVSGTAIRSQAWSGTGGQEGSETSGVSPNNNPRHERPASPTRRARIVSASALETVDGVCGGEDEIVQASRKREGP